MNERIFESIIGALILLTAFIFTFFAWNAVYSDNIDAKYTLHAQFMKSGNISRGDDVKISGVTVGKVENVKIDPSTYLVNVGFSLDSAIKIPEDSAVEILQSGLMGGNYLLITPGAKKDKLAKSDSTLANTKDNQSIEDLISNIVSQTIGN